MVDTTEEVCPPMDELAKVIVVMVTSSLLLLGTGTLIQLIEQLVHDPGPGHPRR
jgi:hypothetical protein